MLIKDRNVVFIKIKALGVLDIFNVVKLFFDAF